MKRGDIIIIVLIIVLATGLSWATSFSKNKEFNKIQIIQDGRILEEYAADKNFSKIVNITEGEFQNSIEIKNGEVKMIHANCPDKLCVKTNPISKNGEMIVCLPHRLYVKIISMEENEETDIVAR